MLGYDIMAVVEFKGLYSIKTTYAVSKKDTEEIKKEILLDNIQLN